MSKKTELLNIGIEYVKQFCELNNVRRPTIVTNQQDYFLYHGCAGYFDGKIIRVYERNCANEAKKPGFSWSHRHYFVDREPCGVVCHEFGHYLHHLLTDGKLTLPKENPISGYEPDKYERFAETVKLFITNPDLLKQYCPKRYETLTKKLGLKPIINEPWEMVMRNAGMDEKYIAAAKKRIAESKKGS